MTQRRQRNTTSTVGHFNTIMSYGGNYSSNDWNDPRHQQQTNEYSNRGDRFRANNDDDDFSHGDYDEAPLPPAVPRFGRPPTSDFHIDSDSRQRTSVTSSRSVSPRTAASTSAPAPRQGGGGSSDRYADSNTTYNSNNDNFQHNSAMWAGDAECYQYVEPPREAARTTSGYRRPGSSMQYGSSRDDNEIHESALGVGVGTSVHYNPYPSLQNSRTNSDAYSYSSASQPGAVASLPATAAYRPTSNTQRLLPPKKEATPIMPPSLAVEPLMPRPRVSRRFQHYTNLPRQPDLAVAKKVKNARLKPGDDDKYVLKCPKCQSFLKIPKMAVLMQCPTCSTVSSATSS